MSLENKLYSFFILTEYLKKLRKRQISIKKIEVQLNKQFRKEIKKELFL